MEANADHLTEWSAQDETMPEPPGQTDPQRYHPDQLPEDMPEEPRRIIEENYLTDDKAAVDPPGGIALNREIDAESPHLTGYAGMEAPTPADHPEATEDYEGKTLDEMTKAELQEYAEGRGYEGITTSLSKDEMLAAIEEAGG